MRWMILLALSISLQGMQAFAADGGSCCGTPMTMTVRSAGNRAITQVSETSSFTFVQKSITINAGDTVTWTNTAGFTHTTTSDTGLWDSGDMGPNATFSHTFPSAGTFGYHCSIHGSPGLNMFGTVTVAASAPAPVINSALTASGTVGQPFSYTITASNTPTSFNATGLPNGLTVNMGNGVISGTPTTTGGSSVALSATNAGGTGTATLVLTINPPAPVIGSDTGATGIVGQSFSYTIVASNTPTSFNATNLPAGFGIDTSTGIISGTPATAGTSTVGLSATNAGGTGTATLALTIAMGATTTSISTVPGPQSQINQQVAITATISSAFTATGTVTFNIDGTMSTIAVSGNTAATSATFSTLGSHSIDASYSGDVNYNGSAAPTFTQTVTALPPPPVIGSATTASVIVNHSFSYTITASNNPNSFDATNLPAGLTVDTATGIISGAPTATGVSNITLSATNVGGTGMATLTLTVNPAPPVIGSATAASVIVGNPFSYTITASNCPTSFDATNLPSGLMVDTATGIVSGTPTATGVSNITLSAINAGGTGTATLTLTVNPPPPVIGSAAAASAIVGNPFSYTITASNSPTSFDATNLPSGLGVNTTTGVISGTPASTGVSIIALSATNTGGTGTATLTLTVNLPPPVINSATTASVIVGNSFSYTITASNNPASFNATNLPGGLTVDTATGIVSGTPETAEIISIELSATNASGTGTATLVLTIGMPAAPAPVIIGSLTVTGAVGQAFSFTISATNSPASFAATGLPDGLSVDTATGIISGTPTAAATSIVTISATNTGGTGAAGLTIVVNPATPLSAPSINSALTATATEGTAFSYQITTADNAPDTFSASGLPSGLSLNGAIISGTPIVAGAAQVALIATNSAGSDSKVLTLTIANTSGAASPPPVLASPPTVSAEQAVIGNTLTFSAAASDSAGDLVAYTWDFGDGTTGVGSTVKKSYTVPGIYTVTLTITNGSASTTSVQTVAINSSDSIANAAPIAVQKASLKFNFVSANKDSLTFSGTIALPAGYAPGGVALSVDVAGFQRASTLNSKGMSTDKTFKLTGKLKSGTFTATGAKFSFSVKNAALFNLLQSAGFTKSTNNPALLVPVILGLGADNFSGTLTLNYAVKSNKNGPTTGTGTKK